LEPIPRIRQQNAKEILEGHDEDFEVYDIEEL